jgi:hypothetical protein
MKVFERDYKINFVDKNNVLVGYDTNTSCCENADWFICKEKPSSIIDRIDYDLEDYVFDKMFFEKSILDQDSLEAGDSVLFRLVNKNNSELFLCLYNVQNGYYSHGFSMEIDGVQIRQDYL